MFTFFMIYWADLIDNGLFTIYTKNMCPGELCHSSYVTVSLNDRVTKDV